MENAAHARIGRNDPCHCGSGKKYKKCCAAKDEAAEREAMEKKWAEAVEKKKHEDHLAAQQKQTDASAAPRAPRASMVPRGGPPKNLPVSAPKFRMPQKSGES
ncbi:MAG: SEC-C metal-binding domain-containing protein [Elusimicrobia bacterium]|nr:SEC-C metal-binding domain-containing protein [Elusimicrobiota bacterium]